MFDKFRTQKARGIATIRGYDLFDPCDVGWTGNRLKEKPVSIFPADIQDVSLPAFARPCPTVPRHGFVESRLVRNHVELQRVIAETLAQDPNGEVILMPKLSGKWSGILTHAGVAIGPGHDGATSGKGAVTIPGYCKPSRLKDAIGTHICNYATVKTAPYIEFVEDDGVATAVQLRDGPEIPQGQDYVPKEMKVEHVLQPNPNMELLDWETMVNNAKPGTVVWHPGGALSSHFSVHAITHEIPVIIDGPEPKVGDVLTPTSWQPKPLTGKDYRKLADMLRERMGQVYGQLSRDQQIDVVMTSVGVLHASPTWDNSEHLLRLRAEGIMALPHFTVVAGLGELRHWNNAGPGRDEDSDRSGKKARYIKKAAGGCGNLDCDQHYPPNSPEHQKAVEAAAEFDAKHPVDEDGRRKPKIGNVIEMSKGDRNVDRSSVYVKALNMTGNELKVLAKVAAEDFNTYGWSSSYGGSTWGDAMIRADKVYGAIDAFLEKPTKANYARIIERYNDLLNAVHNGGKILTKWISERTMTLIHQAPGLGFANGFAAEMVLPHCKEVPAPVVEPVVVDVLKQFKDDFVMLSAEKLWKKYPRYKELRDIYGVDGAKDRYLDELLAATPKPPLPNMTVEEFRLEAGREGLVRLMERHPIMQWYKAKFRAEGTGGSYEAYQWVCQDLEAREEVTVDKFTHDWHNMVNSKVIEKYVRYGKLFTRHRDAGESAIMASYKARDEYIAELIAAIPFPDVTAEEFRADYKGKIHVNEFDKKYPLYGALGAGPGAYAVIMERLKLLEEFQKDFGGLPFDDCKAKWPRFAELCGSTAWIQDAYDQVITEIKAGKVTKVTTTEVHPTEVFSAKVA